MQLERGIPVPLMPLCIGWCYDIGAKSFQDVKPQNSEPACIAVSTSTCYDNKREITMKEKHNQIQDFLTKAEGISADAAGGHSDLPPQADMIRIGMSPVCCDEPTEHMRSNRNPLYCYYSCYSCGAVVHILCDILLQVTE